MFKQSIRRGSGAVGQGRVRGEGSGLPDRKFWFQGPMPVVYAGIIEPDA